jgi:pyoverdine/dityrosine biosynthesis protein Dit1
MSDPATEARQFADDHPILLQLPVLLNDHTGIIATSITVTFEMIAREEGAINEDAAHLYQALLRAFLPGKDLDVLMDATSYESLQQKDLSITLDKRFLRVQEAVKELYQQYSGDSENPLGSYVDTLLALADMFCKVMKRSNTRSTLIIGTFAKGLELSIEASATANPKPISLLQLIEQEGGKIPSAEQNSAKNKSTKGE